MPPIFRRDEGAPEALGARFFAQLGEDVLEGAIFFE
jgi:hypothetical protein